MIDGETREHTEGSAEVAKRAPRAAGRNRYRPRGHTRLGILKDNDNNFRMLCLWLAYQPTYQQVPLDRLRFVQSWLSAGRVLVATQGTDLVGVLAWTLLDSASALRAVSQRRIPDVSELGDAQDAIMISMVAANDREILDGLIRRFVDMQKGRVIIYERHHLGGSKTASFGWFDRAGSIRGSDLS